MDFFYYKAKNKNNEILEGEIKALSFSDAAAKLEARKLVVLEINIKKPKILQNKNTNFIAKNIIFTINEKKEFFNSFYYQYKSGLSINEIFQSILNSSSNKNIKGLCNSIINKTASGSSLKEAFEKHLNALGPAYTKLICAGEASGKLEEILSEIIKNISKEEEIKNNIISSLTYPAIIIMLTIGFFCFFQFGIFKIFGLIGKNISTNDIILILLSTVVKIIIIYAIIGTLFFFIIKNDQIKKKVANVINDLKILSKYFKYYYFQSFFTVLSLSYEAGIPASEAIYAANSVIKIQNINEKIKKAADMIKRGCDIKTAFLVADVFSKYAISQISSGEKSGELDKMFKTVAFDYEKKLELSIKILIKFLEPAMLVFAGVIVLYVASSAYKKYYEGLFSMF